MTRALSLAAIVAVALAACGTTKTPPGPAPEPTTGPVKPVDTTPAGKVCCESFGYGAQMVKCCEAYAWTTADECKVAPGFVGGGKQVVADEKCPR